MTEKINSLIGDVRRPFNRVQGTINERDFSEIDNALSELEKVFREYVLFVTTENIEELKDELKKIKEQIKTLQTDESRESLNEIYLGVRDLVERPSYDPEKEKSCSIEEKIDEMSKEVTTIRGKVSNIEELVQAAKTAPAPALEKPVSSETTELSLTDNVVEEIRRNMKQVIDDMCDYTNGYNRCSSENERLEKENRELTDKVSESESKNNKLSEEISALKNEKEKLEEEISKLQKELDNLKKAEEVPAESLPENPKEPKEQPEEILPEEQPETETNPEESPEVSVEENTEIAEYNSTSGEKEDTPENAVVGTEEEEENK